MVETVIFAVLLIAQGVLRALVSLNGIDPATGFYEGHEVLILMQDALWVTGIAAFLVWAAAQAGQVRWHFPGRWVRGIPLAVLGAALVICSAVSLMRGLLRFTEGDASLTLGWLLAQALGLVSGLILSGASLRLCMGRKNGSGILPAAIPAVYMALLTVAQFLRYPTAYTISDQLLEICALCAGAFFFLAHARVLAGLRGKSACYARGWGFCFSFLALPLCISQQLAAGARAGLMMDGISRLLLAVSALYAGVFSCGLLPEEEAE